MDFNLSDRQVDLQEKARALLDNEFSANLMREAEHSSEGFPRAIWNKGTELGWPGMMVQENSGGQGGSLLDACMLLEEIGRAGATLPLVASSGLSAAILQRSPKGTHRDQGLKDIAAGKIIAPALIDEQGRNEWDTVRLPLTADGNAYTLSGRKILVPFGSSADGLLVTALTTDGETAIIIIDPATQGISIVPHNSGAGVPMSSVEFDNVQISHDQLIVQGLDAGAALENGLHIGSLLATAEAIGLSETIKKLTTEYVSQREAFGQPIGAFQAVAHPCADMHINAETIRLLVYQAAWLIDNGKDAIEEIASTKALANELFERGANDAFCFHGANGFAADFDVQLFMRRIRSFCATMGETHESFERAAQAVGI